MNGKEGDHPLTDIVAHGLDVFSAEIDVKIRDLSQLGSFRNSIASYWLLEVSDLLREAREVGRAVHHGRSLNERQVLAYIDGVLTWNSLVYSGGKGQARPPARSAAR